MVRSSLWRESGDERMSGPPWNCFMSVLEVLKPPGLSNRTEVGEAVRRFSRLNFLGLNEPGVLLPAGSAATDGRGDDTALAAMGVDRGSSRSSSATKIQAHVRGHQTRRSLVYNVRKAFESLSARITREVLQDDDRGMRSLPDDYADLKFFDHPRLHLPISPSRRRKASAMIPSAATVIQQQGVNLLASPPVDATAAGPGEPPSASAMPGQPLVWENGRREEEYTTSPVVPPLSSSPPTSPAAPEPSPPRFIERTYDDIPTSRLQPQDIQAELEWVKHAIRARMQLLKQQERQQQQEARTAADLRGAQSPEHAQE